MWAIVKETRISGKDLPDCTKKIQYIIKYYININLYLSLYAKYVQHISKGVLGSLLMNADRDPSLYSCKKIFREYQANKPAN